MQKAFLSVDLILTDKAILLHLQKPVFIFKAYAFDGQSDIEK